MLVDSTDILNSRIRLTDDELGKVWDILFDDQEWRTRFLVADTGGWMSGRLVLLCSEVIRFSNWNGTYLPVALTRKQLEDAPGLDSEMPVSRQFETLLEHHYGWLPYDKTPGVESDWATTETLESVRKGLTPPGDPHLRSFREIESYHLHATDGKLGHPAGLLMDAKTWDIRFMIIDTRYWLPGRKLKVAIQDIETIDWAEQSVHLRYSRDEMESLPEVHAE